MVLAVFIPQDEHVLVSISFLPSSNVVHVHGLEVVEVLVVLKSPSVRQLPFLVRRTSEPSVFDRL